MTKSSLKMGIQIIRRRQLRGVIDIAVIILLSMSLLVGCNNPAYLAVPSPDTSTTQTNSDYTHNQASTHYSSALTYMAYKDYDSAIAEASKAINIDKEYIEAYTLRGTAYKKINNFNLALADFSNCLSTHHHPNNKYDVGFDTTLHAICYSYAAEVNEAEGDYNAAINNLSAAIQCSPDVLPYYVRRADDFVKINENAKAIADYRIVLERDGEVVNKGDITTTLSIGFPRTEVEEKLRKLQGN